MLTTLLILCTQTAGPQAADYFPMVPGLKWKYESVSEVTETSTDISLEPVKIGETKCGVIETQMRGISQGKTYYSAVDDTLYIVAFNPDKPLPEPYPVLKVGAKPVTWIYTGLTQFLNDFVPLTLKGSTKPIGKRKIMDVERECIEVKLDAQMEGVQSAMVNSKQTSIYAQGVGLVELKEETQVGSRKMVRKTKLISFEATLK